ncbi:uncharacterized protein BDR25DRAFT_253094 [Lindgomyces ingoldianus]|uniref:Uncharacterized protein n=1 Tax=Lindgomyces ingoldianus TaxID=673940 RepID=A0ACB6R8L3_9PLEO|nr:uncharacterized protein BDR25DRAFT_253094 [Lindgomyces ingoldianus]KAF2475653.1 hypothetical protein BDR25DRAFT_253094 [Lindgomyces ingoldianus]
MTSPCSPPECQLSAIPEKPQSKSSQGSGDAIINIDSRATTAVNTTNSYHSSVSLSHAKSEIKETITVPLQDYPSGYPRQAAFQSSEPSFSIYRCFNYLHSRVLLELQDQLRVLESDLTDLDNLDLENGQEKRLKSRAYDLRQAKKEKIESERAGLIATIRDKLVNYDEILVKARELNTFQRPSKRDYGSFRTWFWNEKPLSYELEEQFIKRKEDLVTLRHGREWAGFDGLIEELIRKLHCPLTQKIFTTPELRAKTNNKYIHYYSSSRIEKLVGLIITFIIFVLLILPVVAMYRLTSITYRNTIFDAIGILVVFTLLFSAAMSLLTRAKRHELFAASAAYCAVLVVFISNFGSQAPVG